MGRRVLLPRPSAWSRLAPTPLAVCELSPALLAQTCRSVTPPALPRLPSVPPWIGRPPNHEHRTRTSTRRERSRRSRRRSRRRRRSRPGRRRSQTWKLQERKKLPEIENHKTPRLMHVRPFVARGSALLPCPVLCYTSLRGVSRKLSKRGVPRPSPRHTAHPPIRSELPHPSPHQARRDSGGSMLLSNPPVPVLTPESY